MALVGPPGTEGRLRVVASSQVLGQYVALRIPFQLANCHKGYYLPSTLKDPAQVSVSSALSLSSSLSHSLSLPPIPGEGPDREQIPLHPAYPH